MELKASINGVLVNVSAALLLYYPDYDHVSYNLSTVSNYSFNIASGCSFNKCLNESSKS
jgi:hypothetical protein